MNLKHGRQEKEARGKVKGLLARARPCVVSEECNHNLTNFPASDPELFFVFFFKKSTTR